MARDGSRVLRHLDSGEREARQRYVVVHPGQDGVLAPTTAGYAPVQDWVAAGEPAAGSCDCYVCVPGRAEAPGPAGTGEHAPSWRPPAPIGAQPGTP